MANKQQNQETITISPPNFEVVEVEIVGITQLVLHKFSKKHQKEMENTQRGGNTARGKKKREPRDFDNEWTFGRHISKDGWDGIPASMVRNAMISACRVAGYQMTRAKQTFWCLNDGEDDEGTPLVKITKGSPERFDLPAPLANSTWSITTRPRWKPGWEIKLRIQFDADMLSRQDIVNLIHRAGLQGGFGEGRMSSKNSAGQQWGMFTLKEGK